jgi:hypothetical protein
MTLLTHPDGRSRRLRPHPPAARTTHAAIRLTSLAASLRKLVVPAITALMLATALAGVVALKAGIYLARLNY